MKAIRTLTLSFILAGAAFCAQAQTVDEVVNKYVEALGGADKIKAVKAQQAEGTMTMQGLDIPLKVITIHKKGIRVEFDVMGTSNITVMTPTAGWMLMPINQQTTPVDADAATVKEAAVDLDLTGELYDYKTKGNKAELVGKETLEGQELYKIKLTRTDGSATDYFLDAGTYHIAKKITIKKMEGQEVEVTELLSNYKKTPEGFVYAETVEQLPIGMKMNFSKVQINPPVDEKIFEKPKQP
ncbi:LolA family protein [Chitinophaga lutea]|nr:outer membrane lipoprotein-sorting protein [Chitinophaga lutea]